MKKKNSLTVTGGRPLWQSITGNRAFLRSPGAPALPHTHGARLGGRLEFIFKDREASPTSPPPLKQQQQETLSKLEQMVPKLDGGASDGGGAGWSWEHQAYKAGFRVTGRGKETVSEAPELEAPGTEDKVKGKRPHQSFLLPLCRQCLSFKKAFS